MRLFELELALCSERDDPRLSSLPLQQLDLLLREWSGEETQQEGVISILPTAPKQSHPTLTFLPYLGSHRPLPTILHHAGG